MATFIAMLKAIWPFIKDMLITKRVRGYFIEQPHLAVMTVAGGIVFSGFLYMAQQTAMCQNHAVRDAARIAQLQAQVDNLKKNNDTLQYVLKSTMRNAPESNITVLGYNLNTQEVVCTRKPAS